MPPSASIQNKHLKQLASSWLRVGYCEVLNSQPLFVSGSMLGVNNGPTAPAGPSPPTAAPQLQFIYGGLFDGQSLSDEMTPLPPDMLEIVKGRGGGREAGSRTDTNGGPPPPPVWRCAHETSARMDAYLRHHQGSLSGQQLWLRDLKAARRRLANTSSSPQPNTDLEQLQGPRSRAPQLLVESTSYVDLMEGQVSGKRQQCAQQRVVAAQRGNIESGGGGGGGDQKQMTPNHPSPAPTVAEAAQYIALADREFLAGTSKRIIHCEDLLKKEKSKSSDGLGCTEAGSWATKTLKSLNSDGCSALWFTCEPSTSQQPPSPTTKMAHPSTVKVSLHHTGNSRAVLVKAPLIKAYLSAHGAQIKEAAASPPAILSSSEPLADPRSTAFSVTEATFGYGSVGSFTSKTRGRYVIGLTADHCPTHKMERRRANLAAVGKSINSVMETSSVGVPDHVVTEDFGKGKAVAALNLQPPSLVTRALGLAQYKLNPKMAFHDQIIISSPSSTELDLEKGELLLLCNRGVFESEASSDVSFAADGATVDEIVEAALAEVFRQVTNAISTKTNLTLVPMLGGREINDYSDIALDTQAIAAAICSAGLDNSGKKGLQAMVVTVPPQYVDGGADKKDIFSLQNNDRNVFERRRINFPATASNGLVPSAILIHSFAPGPIHPTHLRADPLFRAAFVKDLQRASVETTEWLMMRWQLLRQLFLSQKGGNSAAVVSSLQPAIAAAYPSTAAQFRRALADEAQLFLSRNASLEMKDGDQKDDFFRDISIFLFGKEK